MRSHDRYGPPTRTDYRLIVENLSSRVSWQVSTEFKRICSKLILHELKSGFGS